MPVPPQRPAHASDTGAMSLRAASATEPAAGAATELDVSLEAVARPEDIGPAWRDLEARADCSFFQSWAWIGCWLDRLPQRFAPRALVVRDGARIVGLGMIVRHRYSRHGFVRPTGLFLNATGDAYYDNLTLEYNGLLVDRDAAGPVERAALAWLASHDSGSNEAWDEITLGGLDETVGGQYEAIAADAGLDVWVHDRKRCDFVDLDAVRRSGGDYLAGLSRNTRYQLRRAIKLYGGDGALSLDAATSAGEALDFYAGLEVLHQAYWTGRGQPGSFANGFFRDFHRNLIERCFASGEVQLLRAAAGGEPFGYLYNFVAGGRVYAYQSGFSYGADPKLKPGLVSHYLAIGHSLAAGARVYDFMAGESRYKASLGTDYTEMTWLVLQRPRLVFRIERTLRALKRRVMRR